MSPRARRSALLASAVLVLVAPACRADNPCAGTPPGPVLIECLRVSVALQQYKDAPPEDKADALTGYYADRDHFLQIARQYQQDRNNIGTVPTEGAAGEMSQPIGTLDMAEKAVDLFDAQISKEQVNDVGVKTGVTKNGPNGEPVKDQPTTPATQAIPSKNPLTAGAGQDLTSGNPAGAIQKLDQVLGQNKNDPDALALRAQAKLAQGDKAGALTDALRAQELKPNDPETKALVSGLQGAARAAEKLKKSKLDFGATRDLAEGGDGPGGPAPGAGRAGPDGARTAPGAPPGFSGGLSPAQGLRLHAEKLFDIGDFTGALLPLREAIDLDPKNPQLWDELAEVSNKLDNPKGAIDAADHALALDPKDARALRAKSYAEFQMGDYRGALADAERALTLDPGSGLGHFYRAMALEKIGDVAGALAEYQAAVRLDPTLAPLAEPGLKRLGGAAPRGGASRLTAFRIGAIGLSTVLVILGLMGTATGRALTQGARRLLTPVSPASREERSSTIQVGSRVGGHYRITRELGRGGMGVVYLAQDETLQRPVAIKQLQSDIRSDPEELERFLREARLVAQLKHENLAQIHAVVDDGDLLLVFEYVEGEPLDGLLSRAKRLAPARARQLVGQICDALQYAHARRIVHRDLKPANVMIDAAGAAKVMDFGIAHQARGTATMTKTSVSGTPPYMAPEQGFGSVSKSSDLYALAVMTYEMLTGVRPFNGPDFLEPKLRKEFAPATSLNPSLPPGLDEFFAKALDPDPTKRHADAAEFARAFGRVLDATPSRA